MIKATYVQRIRKGKKKTANGRHSSWLRAPFIPHHLKKKAQRNKSGRRQLLAKTNLLD